MVRFSNIFKYSNMLLASVILGVLMVLLFPIPKLLLDFLLAFSIAISIIVLMTTLFIVTPLELSVFPTILLVTTLIRLSLNISSTRLILSEGHLGSHAAGKVIEAFGHFVMQGNVVIGLIVFLILTLINFIVITKGSGRIAEVAARFNLDSMPGKQMSIDADLSAGLIDEETAKNKRKILEDENTFYGSMDGANKFVRGDSIAGMVITFINLVGGMIVGIVQKQLSFSTAVQTYSILTIGDGLISQVPSLIISVSSGLLVTKAAGVGSTDQLIFKQIGKYPQSLLITAAVTALMSLLPGLPFFAFISISLVISSVTYVMIQKINNTMLNKNNALGIDKVSSAVQNKQSSGIDDADSTSNILAMDDIRIELGHELVILTDMDDMNLITQIRKLRRQIGEKFGFIIPSVRIKDNVSLKKNEYIIKIKDIIVGKGFVKPDSVMVINPTLEELDIEGEEVIEQSFGLKAKWIDIQRKEEAISKAYNVIDPVTVITTYLSELIKDNLTELLSYSSTQQLLDSVNDENKNLVKTVVPEVVPVSILQKVLHKLLLEKVSIRDLPTILEAIADATRIYNNNITYITEEVRVRLSRQICYSYMAKDNLLSVIVLSYEWERTFADNLVGNDMNKKLSIQPSKIDEFIIKINSLFDKYSRQQSQVILLTSAYIRPYVRSVIERFKPNLSVISHSEIYRKIKIRTLEYL
ncbi:flagellar biosynthesis protein FlhA [Rickettsia endosymbiont of Cardiosporidium cionae]|uniref:flagellar biosynthesis protein FlhA n=1 Tax=Rickettsia endosymbiont of Cardiosporidium cionae TaxID=2777155 RepID=UPI001893C9D8|nr:flagellar biosynthesis protein FlhA [Rickettsia endosymbiont of Cardiosporidium cionae]KAF8818554.1 Flagellar biosynthesis protein FlhA [Rickettsia endosymbiont of Cardiosporidium cionae]